MLNIKICFQPNGEGTKTFQVIYRTTYLYILNIPKPPSPTHIESFKAFWMFENNFLGFYVDGL